MPAIVLPEISHNAADLAILSAAIAAAFVVFEYGFTTPSLIEFRFAAPYNRIRFALLALLLTGIAFAFRGPVEQTATTIAVSSFAVTSASIWEFTGSPLMFFNGMTKELDAEGRLLLSNAAALSLSLTVLALIVFSAVIWMFHWPLKARNFNLWVNMPNFDSNVGVKTQQILRQSALVNMIIGLSLPFLIPQAALTFIGPLEPISSTNSLLLLWMIAIWCFVPAASILRSIALYKVATLINEMNLDEDQDA
ncbi:MAG: hypothetical protein KC451_04640 [Amylibacter sp.]|nr:hypothetical protein [Amylibacter sp.]